MRAELYSKIAEKYKQQYESFGEHSGGSSFRDSKNLVCDPEGIRKVFEDESDEEKKYTKKYFRRNIRALRDYFRLLDRFSEFREVEMNGGSEGYFPDLMSYAYSQEGVDEQEEIFGDAPCAKAHYILLAKKRFKE